MNDLIDVSREDRLYAPSTDGDWSDLYAVIGPLKSGVEEFEAGNWAGGLLGFANAALDYIQMIADPIGTLASSAVSFLMEHMSPLPQIMNELVGNPQMVGNVSSTWGNMSGALSETAADLSASAEQCLQTWTGDAADAFRRSVDRRVLALQTLSTGAAGVGGGLAIAAGIVEAIRTIVTDLISDLVGKLISWGAQALYTFGLGLTWIVPQAKLAIADWTTEITSFTTDLVNAITTGTGLVELVTEGLGQLQTIMNAMAGGASRATA